MNPVDLLRELGATVTVEIEIPKGSFAKWRRDGRVDFISPVPCPYNYGCIPNREADDGDHLDALVLGSRLARGATLTVAARGIVDFMDRGAHDPKVVCSALPLTPREVLGLRAFFGTYAIAKRALAAARGWGGETRFRGIVLR